MRSSLHKILISLSVLILILQSNPVKANNDLVTFSAEVDSGDNIEVTFFAHNATDLYAYDLVFTYDAPRLRLIDASSGISGFSVEPILEEDQIRFAHTLIGSRPGVQGNVELVTLVFERIDAGEAVVVLNEAKLVDADLASTAYQPDSKVVIKRFVGLLHDISGHWAQSAIEKALDMGSVVGYPDGTFRPQNQITRAEFAAMLVRAIELPVEPEPVLSFADAVQIPDWASPSIAAAYNAGLISGYEDNTFRANQLINRTEMAVMLVRALAYELDQQIIATAESTIFTDEELIPDWGYAYVAAAAEAGIVKGRDTGVFAPYDLTTRAESVVAILNLLEIISN